MHLTNEQVWLQVDRGVHVDRPASCPELLFASIIKPCFAFVPADRPTFAMLADYFLILNSTGAEANEDTAHDSNFPRIDTDDHSLRDMPARSSGLLTAGAPKSLILSGSANYGAHDAVRDRLSEILKSTQVAFLVFLVFIFLLTPFFFWLGYTRFLLQKLPKLSPSI